MLIYRRAPLCGVVLLWNFVVAQGAVNQNEKHQNAVIIGIDSDGGTTKFEETHLSTRADVAVELNSHGDIDTLREQPLIRSSVSGIDEIEYLTRRAKEPTHKTTSSIFDASLLEKGGLRPAPTPGPTPAPSNDGDCTGPNKDPYATGSKVDCCDGCNMDLSNHGGGWRWYYLCIGDCSDPTTESTTREPTLPPSTRPPTTQAPTTESPPSTRTSQPATPTPPPVTEKPPTPAPTGSACINADCGCDLSGKEWCNRDNAPLTTPFCQENPDNCGNCNGVWCDDVSGPTTQLPTREPTQPPTTQPQTTQPPTTQPPQTTQPSTTKFPPSQGRLAYATRYWDCCKAHCSWQSNTFGKVSPLATCSKDDVKQSDANIVSACETPAPDSGFTCFDEIPWAANSSVAFGFAAVPARGDVCGKCYRLTFTGDGKYGSNAGATRLANKVMIVQATNIGHDVEDGQFDVMIPGGGVGAFDACSYQWGVSKSDLGVQYGGFLSACQEQYGYSEPLATYKTCVLEKCDAIFGSGKFPQLHKGCKFFVDWYESADNPKLTYTEVTCPPELISISAMDRGETTVPGPNPSPNPNPSPGLNPTTGDCTQSSNCECGWASAATCGTNDGSTCNMECCCPYRQPSPGPNPPPSTPTPVPTSTSVTENPPTSTSNPPSPPTSNPPSSGQDMCPYAEDAVPAAWDEGCKEFITNPTSNQCSGPLCGSCKNPGSMFALESYTKQILGFEHSMKSMMNAKNQGGYFIGTDLVADSNPEEHAYMCMDWTFGSSRMNAAQEKYNQENVDNVLFGVGTDGCTQTSNMGGCYRITYGEAGHGSAAEPEDLLVQAVNSGHDVHCPQFDLQVGVGGQGIHNNCVDSKAAMFPGSQATMGNVYGGWDNRAQCSQSPQFLKHGTFMQSEGDDAVKMCELSFDKKLRGENGKNSRIIRMSQVTCPAELTALTGFRRADQDHFGYQHNTQGVHRLNPTEDCGFNNQGTGENCLSRMMDCRKPSASFKDNVDTENMCPGLKLLPACTVDGYTRIASDCGMENCWS